MFISRGRQQLLFAERIEVRAQVTADPATTTLPGTHG
jgi:hypothetical protein